jgi:glycosyltransferase involved in cell wall biosynthesis
MSEHEGFCVPAIEALHFKVPLIFFNSSALPETMGQGAIGIDQKDPLRTACIMQELIHNNAAKEELISKSQSELSRFKIDIFKSNLSKLVSEALA